MWVLVLLSVLAGILGTSVVVLYALRLTGTWDLVPQNFESQVADEPVEEEPVKEEPAKVPTTAYTLPDSSDTSLPTDLATFLSNAPSQFTLASYTNIQGDRLDDSYLGTYVRSDINSVVDFSTTSLVNIGPRVAVWVNSENSERIIGLYYHSSKYAFYIGYYEDNATYGERIVAAVNASDVDSANILDVTGNWEIGGRRTTIEFTL